ncbi:exopolysaccharide biosynthesis polyprenyl glycosylphosphotransferase [Sphingobium sufflavum]|uniref:exopolysaccharide biosynthesis polyprenyl glycosylphosphotransferase n=1 Tax=Sphingobium sufflavum TaxID=1129547 RepID=UPI001F2000E0|nr:exopolysaccharide biosynthesis polyprenyl glycosylphosphotransferase [Sphingobium sufflavum]MCE7798827.1 exopolysaccharide biosynthesis polyprenyl glycosylphosphotransferase [Sphingobium sufflavum]
MRALVSPRKPARQARTVSKQTVRLILYSELLVLDLASLLIGCLLAGKLLHFPVTSPLGLHLGYLIPPLYVLMALNNGAYSIKALGDDQESLRRSLSALGVAMLIALLVMFFGKIDVSATRLPFMVSLLAGGGLLGLSRFTFRYHARSQHQGALVDELLIVDHDDYDGPLPRYTINARAEQITPDLRSPEMIGRVAHYMNGFDRVVIYCPIERQHAWSLILKGANVQGEILLERPFSLDAIGLNRFGGHDTLIVSRGPLSITNRAKKRLLDLAATIPTIILLSPLLLLVAILIKLESKGPVIFRQQRVGRGNRMFAIMKFRSMRVEMSDATGSRSASKDDDRITRVGRFIRATSIDELPQLFNVLIGDMSLVGPRPHALGSLAGARSFWDVDEQYWVRHALKPGITGLAQIRGFRGATHHQEDLENRLRADLEYLDGWRLWRDVSILMATAKVVVHKNAY